MVNLLISKSKYEKDNFVISKILKLCKENSEVLYIVPEQWSMEMEGIIAQKLGAFDFDKVKVFSFSRLANDVFRKHGSFSKPIASQISKTSLIGKAVISVYDSLKFYKSKAENTSFYNKLYKAFSVIEQSGINKDDVLGALENDNLFDKYFDIFLIYEEYTKLLDKKFFESKSVLSVLKKKLENCDYLNEKTVIFDGFFGFTGEQYNLIELIMKRVKECHFCIFSDDLQSKNDAFYSSVSMAKKLIKIASKQNITVKKESLSNNISNDYLDEICFLEENLFCEKPKIYDKKCDHIKVFRAFNPNEEVLFIANDIKKWIMQNNSYCDISVICGDISKYQNIIYDTFKKYDIPYFLDKKQSLLTKPILNFVIHAINAIIYNYRFEDIMALLKTSLTYFSDEEIMLLENYIFKWGKKGSDWYNVEKWSQNPSGLKPMEEKDEINLEKINAIKNEITLYLEKFKEDTKNVTCGKIIKAIYSLLDDFKIKDGIAKNSKYFIDHADVRSYEEYLRLYNIFMDVLDDIYFALGDEKMSLEMFLKVLIACLKNYEFGSVIPVLDCVLVGSANRVRHSGSKRVYILGLNDGEYEVKTDKSALINQNDIDLLRKKDVMIAKNIMEKSFDSIYLLYNSIFSSSGDVILSYSATSVMGETLQRSIYADKILQIMGIDEIQRNDENINDFILSLDSAKNFICQNREGNDSLYDLLKNDYNFDANKVIKPKTVNTLEREVALEIYSNRLNISQSRLQSYNECPFKHFLQYGLRLDTNEKVEMNAANIGTFVHEGLKALLQSAKNGEFDIYDISNEKLTDKVNEISKAYLKNYLYDFDITNSRFMHIFNKMSKAFALVAIEIKDELNQSKFKISEFEYDFSKHMDYEKIDEKFAYKFIGIIDRIDTFDYNNNKYIKIIDYKTGEKSFNFKNIYNGLDMQLVLYMSSVLKSDLYQNAKIAAMTYLKAGINDKALENSAADFEKDKQSFYKRNGVYVDNLAILDAIESNIAGKYNSPRIKKDGTLSEDSMAFDEADLNNLCRFAQNKLKKSAGEILNGNVEIYPIKGDKNGCDYCKFGAICKFDFDKNRVNVYKKIDKKEFFERIKSEI